MKLWSKPTPQDDVALAKVVITEAESLARTMTAAYQRGIRIDFKINLGPDSVFRIEGVVAQRVIELTEEKQDV